MLACGVVGISNGLVCFSLSFMGLKFVILNPATRQFRYVTTDLCHERYLLFLGFDLHVKDSELIRIVITPMESGNYVIRVHVYAMGSDVWREIRVKLREGFYLDHRWSWDYSKAVAIDGVFYWYVKDEHRTFVVYYDVHKEVFDLIETPSVDDGTDSKLVEMEGELALVHYKQCKGINICVLNEDMTWRSIHKKISACLARQRKRTILVGCTRNGELIFRNRFRNNFKFLSFDPTSKETKYLYNLSVDGAAIKDVDLYFETLEPVIMEEPDILARGV